jgi:hypothetical protein
VDTAGKEAIVAINEGTICVNEEELAFSLSEKVPEKAYLESTEECRRIYRESIANTEEFWGQLAEQVQWARRWDKVLLEAFANGEHQWFVGVRLNICRNGAAGTSERFWLRIFVVVTLTMLFWLLVAAFFGALWRCCARLECRCSECDGWKGSLAARALTWPAIAGTPHALPGCGK